MFKRLKVDGWRQYEDVDITFHHKLTIITGANSAGKTTLLNMLNQHLGGYMQALVGVPILSLGGLSYLPSFWKPLRFINPQNNMPPNMNYTPPRVIDIGSIEYYGGSIANITIPEKPGSTYSFQFQNQQQVKGISINSSRPLFKYEPVSHIPTNVTNKSQAYNSYRNSSMNRYSGNSNNNKNEIYYIKETIISWAAFGPGNNVIEANQEAISLLKGFELILSKVLPATLKFKSLSVRIPEVVLNTDTGEFPIDAVSGGVASIIDLAWQIYMYDNNGFPFVVTIDEPENHLHPEIQKNLLPNMVDAFPTCQFIVATHSPFIISSISESNAYALRYNENNKVVSVLLDRVNKAGTANDILKEVLGLEDTMPNWVDGKLEEIIDRYKDSGISKDNINRFKQELVDAGLGKYVPSSLIKLVEELKQKARQDD
jgi:predicted ATPase